MYIDTFRQGPYKFRSPRCPGLSTLKGFRKVARSGGGDIPLPVLLRTSADGYSGNIDARPICIWCRGRLGCAAKCGSGAVEGVRAARAGLIFKKKWLYVPGKMFRLALEGISRVIRYV